MVSSERARARGKVDGGANGGGGERASEAAV